MRRALGTFTLCAVVLLPLGCSSEGDPEAANAGAGAVSSTGGAAPPPPPLVGQAGSSSPPPPARIGAGAQSRTAANPSGDEARIRELFATYRQALLDHNGEAAWELVNTETKGYYEQRVKNALNMNRNQLERLDVYSIIMVLDLRAEFSRDELAALDGRGYFIHVVDRGFMSPEGAEQFPQLDRVEVQYNQAQGYVPGESVAIFHFFRESDGWKFSLTRTISLVMRGLSQAQGETGVGKLEFALAVASETAERNLPEAILDGPLD